MKIPFVLVAVSTLCILASGCDTPVASQVDSLIKNCMDDAGSKLGNVDHGFYCLKKICGKTFLDAFDSNSQECFCPAGLLFSSASVDASGAGQCNSVSFDGANIGVDSTEAMLTGASEPILQIDPWSLASDHASVNTFLDQWAIAEIPADAKPFRLAFYGKEAIQVHMDPKLSSANASFAADDHTSVALGRPFMLGEKPAVYDAFYEPDSKYIVHALAQAQDTLSAADQARFSGIASKKPDTTSPTPLESTVIAAYASFQKIGSFRPQEVDSPYESGCASYCVATEVVPLDPVNKDYIASYKKVYQLGVPSARVIVVQDAKTHKGVALIALNPAETISTIYEIDDNGVKTYDRYWNILFTAATPKNPFQYLLNRELCREIPTSL